MNLEDIAELSGTSRSTVSRVINNAANVSPKTRERVLQVIQEVNYQPNAAARGLAAGRTRVIGLVIPTGVTTLFTDPYFPTLIKGISATCNKLDHSVMLWLAEPDFERRTIVRVINSGMIDGVIVSSVLVNDPIIESLQRSTMPFVLVGRHPFDLSINSVDVDSKQGTFELVQHLLSLGRRRIGTIAGPQNMIAGLDRLLGYQNALRQQGIEPDPQLVAYGDFSTQGGYSAMKELLPHQPDAIFAASDTMAQGAMRAIRETSQYSVPTDIAVVGFDNLPLAANTEPPLTTVSQPIELTGDETVRLLIELILDKTRPAQQILLPTELVIRESCGARLTSSPN